MTPSESDRDALPTALLRPRRRWSYLWLLPLVCALVAGWLLYNASVERGIPITVEFRQGHGLKPGDGLRYRGITVGTVENVRLAQDLNSVKVSLRMDPHARDLARAGSRFWIVRPQLDLEGARGLDTVVGANYVRVLPGQGEPRRSFVGLEEPPLAAEPGGLEIVLSTPQKGNLRPGAPVTYRQVAIGAILSVDLARDATAVVARAHIQPVYAALIRENTRFWKTGGARFSAGLTGLSLNVDSVRGLLLGGVSLALPSEPGKPAAQGDGFRLYEEPEPAWLEWTPALSLHPTGADAPRPQLLPTVLNWKSKNFLYLTQEKQRRGWLVPAPGGLLGPLDLLTEPAAALPDSVGLEVAEAPIPLNPDLTQLSKIIGILPYEHTYPVWTNVRRIATPEDTLVIAGSSMPERFIAATRYRVQDPYWTVDPAAAFDPGWHGAAVIAESDGALVGILLVDEDEAKLARLEPLAKFSNPANLNPFE